MFNYLKYLVYILEHKKNVFIECCKRKMYIHAFMHDISKLTKPSEFIAYSNWFYGKYGITMKENNEEHIKCKEKFEKAFNYHHYHNKHHWEYWEGRDMPYKYRKQMLVDWFAMAKKFGGTPQEYYLTHYKDIRLTDKTRMLLEFELDLNNSIICNYGHTMEQFAKMYDEETYNIYFGWIKDRFRIDTYSILK